MPKVSINMHRDDFEKIIKIMDHFNTENIQVNIDSGSGIGYLLSCEIEYRSLPIELRDKPSLVFPIVTEEDW